MIRGSVIDDTIYSGGIGGSRLQQPLLTTVNLHTRIARLESVEKMDNGLKDTISRATMPNADPGGGDLPHLFPRCVPVGQWQAGATREDTTRQLTIQLFPCGYS